MRQATVAVSVAHWDKNRRAKAEAEQKAAQTKRKNSFGHAENDTTHGNITAREKIGQEIGGWWNGMPMKATM